MWIFIGADFRSPGARPARDYTAGMNALREQLAAAAARLIVEDGLDYAGAKRRALHQLLGAGAHAEQLPDNADVRAQVEQYLALFEREEHPQRLRQLRAAALDLMEAFAEFRPYLAGAVWNGTATAHSGLHVLLFTDDSKAVDIHCINRGMRYRVTQAPHYAGRAPVECLEFDWPLADGTQSVAASVSVYPAKDERGVLRNGSRGGVAERGSLDAVRALVRAGGQP